MSLIHDRVQKAIQRSAGIDLKEVREEARTQLPSQMAGREELEARRRYFMQVSEDTSQAELAYERIIHGNELQDVNYLARGVRVARAVGRISIREPNGRLSGYGTGFLIGEGVLLTNNHVLPSSVVAGRSELEMEYERDEWGNQLPGVKFSLEPGNLFFTHPELDFSVVAVSARAMNAERDLSEFGCLPLVGVLGKVVEGEWLTIIQHPGGELKQLCVRENRLLRRTPDVLWYSSDTLGGSSGSPVCNNDWLVVALHHSGVPEIKNGKWQTVDGQDYDERLHREEDIKWVANEGIRVSRIVQELQRSMGDHPLIAECWKEASRQAFPALPPEPSDPAIPRLKSPIAPIHTSPQTNHPMTPEPNPQLAGQKYLLSFDAAGIPSISQWPGGKSTESTRVSVERSAGSSIPASRGVRFQFDHDYSNRKGYDAHFLTTKGKASAHSVQLPVLQGSLEGNALRLLEAADDKDYVLKYTNMSLVMHKKRKFAIYSAANVDFGRRYSSLQSKRVWKYDPRISVDDQTGDEAYDNAFDRGHLTRQEDMEYGDTMQDALQSTADTCHWTNVCTQHAKFNRGKDWWQGMERHILEYSVDPREGKGFRAQIFTGPVLAKNDPEFPEVPDLRIPMKFWKVCAAVTSSGKLFAVAYLLDQTPVIKKYGLKEAAGEVPFEPYKLFQLPISELESMIQLKFTCGLNGANRLSTVDPLEGVSAHDLPGLDADQNGYDDRYEQTGGSYSKPQGWLDLTSHRPFFGA